MFPPFAGSGSTALASKICGRRYLAIEVDDALCEVTRKRLAYEKLF
ncbi:MAG: hypothetical protein DRJ03_24050 [Chloroflexi bacterium]|nr:MAG: hypothetical protein DRJ03_24050 [Chloroflexota bacterium]